MCQGSEEVFLKKIFKSILLYDRCYPKGCAAPGEVQCQCNTQGTLSKLKRTPSQAKINVTSKSPVGDISVVTLIRTDTTLDHSQKAEKVCSSSAKRGTTLTMVTSDSGLAIWVDYFSSSFISCCFRRPRFVIKFESKATGATQQGMR